MGITYERKFSIEGKDPFKTGLYGKEVTWEKKKARLKEDRTGEGLIDFETPTTWSPIAVDTVGGKYAHGNYALGEKENSARQIIWRVSSEIADSGMKQGYFETEKEARAFEEDLEVACTNQAMAENSPVWFSVGVGRSYTQRTGKPLITGTRKGHYVYDLEERLVKPDTSQSYESPQAAACFIQSVDDSMEGIAKLTTSEMMLFKYGSGTGTDLSTLRSSIESLSEGGVPSGPLSFMRIWDQSAAVIKSGGKTRRAAKMQSLKVSHPDIAEFIDAKPHEEKKAWALIEAGYDGSFGGEAYGSVMFQNSNLSVRLTDEFMQAVLEDKEWTTQLVTDPSKPGPTYRAKDLLMKIAEGTYICGDPGVQYDTTINKWHTCKNSGPINASNPCSEYMFLDNSACNLASINLMKFVNLKDGTFDTEKFKNLVRTTIIAQDILVDKASYPGEEIAENSHRYRPLGLGHANLGAVLMALGMPYDSEEGRTFASAVTSLMTNTAYQTSKELARGNGAFEGYQENMEPMTEVLTMHKEATEKIDESKLRESLRNVPAEAKKMGLEMLLENEQGYRNAQVTVLAPTGTIGLMMDCDTKGVEPDISLIKYKHFVGEEKPRRMINESVEPSLERLGYGPEQIKRILGHLEKTETIETSPDLKPEHLKIFDCSLKAKEGKRYIPYQAHLKMMAAVQPFLSGAISKTVNMPEEATVKEIYDTYIGGWKMGLKAVAIYRDNSKKIQPMRTSDEKTKGSGYGILVREGNEPGIRPLRKGDEEGLVKMLSTLKIRLPPQRRRMPQTGFTIRHKFEIGDVATGSNGEKSKENESHKHETYLHLGFFDDGYPGETFYTSGKEGGTVGGTLDGFGTALSLLLQSNHSVTEIVEKFENSAFPPMGTVIHPREQGILDVEGPEKRRFAKSIIDYTMKYLKDTCTEQNPGEPRKDTPYIAFRKGLMGQRTQELPKKEEEKHFDHTDFLKMKKEDLLEMANAKCTGGVCGCNGDAISVGRCGWWCINTGRLIEGTCAE